jgi:DNA polymerase-3 subunit gamma/tau
VVVARRFRPRSFSDLVGQDHIGQALRVAIESDRVGHAYLFCGARGTGKTSTARIFAKCLNAPDGPTIDPPQDTDIAQSIDAGSDVDVLEIDAASNRGIDEIRQLRSGVGMRPSRGRYKIYIIDEVHMLTKEAFNALLKTLEEPPPHVKFILCTTDPEKIPITVRSRCQRFDFLPIKSEEIIRRLQEIVVAEGASAEPAALRLLARRAAGSMRDSQSLLEQVLSYSGGQITLDTVHAMLGTADDQRIAAIAEVVLARQAATALHLLDQMIAEGVDPGQLAEQLLGYFRDLLVAAVDGGPELLRFVAAEDYPSMQAAGERLGTNQLLAVVGLLDQAIVRMRQSLHGRVLLEIALVQICALPDLQILRDLLDGNAASPIEKKKSLSLPPAGVSQAQSPHPRKTEPDAADLPTRPSAPSLSLALSHPAVGNPPAPEAERDAATVGLQSPATDAAHDRLVSHAALPSNGQDEQRAARKYATRTEKGLPEESSTEATPTSVQGPPPDVDPGKLAAAWQEMIGQLEDLTADAARQAEEVLWLGNGRARVVFPGDKQLTRNTCDRPERRARLERELSRCLGTRVTLEFTTRPTSQVAAPAAPRLGTNQRLAERRAIESDPLVRRIIELFGAEISRVDVVHAPPSSAGSASHTPGDSSLARVARQPHADRPGSGQSQSVIEHEDESDEEV